MPSNMRRSWNGERWHKDNKTIFILRQSTKCNKIHRHYNNSRQDIKAMDKLQSVWWGY